MRERPRIPPLLASFAIVLALAAALALTDGPPPPGAAAPAAEPPPPHEAASPQEIAARLERLRDLEFERVPEVRTLSAGEWRRKTAKMAEEGAGSASEQREADAVADFLKLSGLATPDFEIEQATEGVGELIGGFYRPKSNRLVLVEQPLQGPRGVESVTAHELDHALQDQNYPDVLDLGSVTGEREIALSALVEGDAGVVERRYARRHLGISPAAEEKSLLSPANLAAGLPPALVASVRFPYTAGADFVATLERRGGWELVDDAFEDPPTTSEQILHPGKWIAGEEGERVEPDGAAALGPGWQSLATVESGELDALVILASGVPSDVAARAAKGWQGGAFEALRLPGGGTACRGVCRDRRAAVAVYEWEDDAEAVEFAAAAVRYLAERLSGGRRDGLTFPVGDGAAAALAVDGRRTAVAYAPSPELARRLADDSALESGT
ncbi:MAG TPA: hypothetical protein VFY99_00235 [Solirubrobacterales bacterium]